MEGMDEMDGRAFGVLFSMGGMGSADYIGGAGVCRRRARLEAF